LTVCFPRPGGGVLNRASRGFTWAALPGKQRGKCRAGNLFQKPGDVYIRYATVSAPTSLTAVRANAECEPGTGLHAHVSKQLSLHIFIEPESRESTARILFKLFGHLRIGLYFALKRGNNCLYILVARIKDALNNSCFVFELCHVSPIRYFRGVSWFDK
jgi:hypothetical protein